MKLTMGNTEIDFSVINNSDLVFNKSVEIPLQDLHDTAVMLRNGSEDTIDLWERVRANEEKIGELELENEQHIEIAISAMTLLHSLLTEKNTSKFMVFLKRIDCYATTDSNLARRIKEIRDKVNSNI